MKRFSLIGWLIASLLLAQNAATGLTAPAATNPLEGRLLQHSNGSSYVYHDGTKFSVQPASTGDQVIDAIPTATQAQWDILFTTTPAGLPSPPNPEPIQGYS
jgi:hypothetical protein